MSKTVTDLRFFLFVAAFQHIIYNWWWDHHKYCSKMDQLLKSSYKIPTPTFILWSFYFSEITN